MTRDEELAERRRLYLQGCAETTIRERAIDACQICDVHGYRGGYVCDHVDRTETYRRGHALASQALAEAKRARNDTEGL